MVHNIIIYSVYRNGIQSIDSIEKKIIFSYSPLAILIKIYFQSV